MKKVQTTVKSHFSGSFVNLFLQFLFLFKLLFFFFIKFHLLPYDLWITHDFHWDRNVYRWSLNMNTRGPKDHISCIWVQCVTFLRNLPEIGQLFTDPPYKYNTMVEDIEILLLVKFRWIPLSAFRGEVENVSANQRPGRPSCFSDRPEKHKLGREHWDLASCQVFLNSVQRFQRRSQKCEKLTTDNRRTDNPWSQ